MLVFNFTMHLMTFVYTFGLCSFLDTCFSIRAGSMNISLTAFMRKSGSKQVTVQIMIYSHMGSELKNML